MSKIWLISDLHLFHNKEFVYAKRGFSSAEEHAQAVINRWNEVVSDENTVWVLGDCILNENEKGIAALLTLKGHKHLVLGNHDTPARIKLYEENHIFESIQYATVIKKNKKSFYLSHYPTNTGNYDFSTLFNIHGHTHSKNKWCELEYCYNVNADAHDCRPVDLDTIIQDFKDKKAETYM